MAAGNKLYRSCRVVVTPLSTDSTGATGPRGITGSTGPVGATGSTGPVGATGATGPIGATGAGGGAGAVGATGATGPSTPGATGATGAQGPTGPGGGATGATGPQGATGPGGGATGPAGATGATGPSGATQSNGTQANGVAIGTGFVPIASISVTGPGFVTGSATIAVAAPSAAGGTLTTAIFLDGVITTFGQSVSYPANFTTIFIADSYRLAIGAGAHTISLDAHLSNLGETSNANGQINGIVTSN
jgi:hypothetical protein